MGWLVLRYCPISSLLIDKLLELDKREAPRDQVHPIWSITSQKISPTGITVSLCDIFIPLLAAESQIREVPDAVTDF